MKNLKNKNEHTQMTSVHKINIKNINRGKLTLILEVLGINVYIISFYFFLLSLV